MTALSILNKIASGLMAVFGSTAALLAGEASYPFAIGFSEDGRKFVFAEAGIQDGSGFAFANAFALDLVNDAWIVSPIRLLEENENSNPLDLLRKATDAIVDRLDNSAINRPARLIYAGPVAYTTASEIHVQTSWQYRSVPTSQDNEIELSLSAFPLESDRCSDETFGYRVDVNGAPVHRDLELPKSRGCVAAYSIERIYIADDVFRAPYAVALIGVHRQGFEGLSMRHIALPIPLGEDR